MTQNSRPTTHMDDEIDLLELVAALWARKWLIMSTTAAFFLGGLLYVSSATPIYQASLNLMPPTLSDLLNAPVLADMALESEIITPRDAFNRGLAQLANSETQAAVLSSRLNGFSLEEDDPDAALLQFSELVSIAPPKSKDDGSATLSFEHRNALYAQHAVEALVTQANKDSGDALIEDIRYFLNTRIQLQEDRLKQAELLLQSTEVTDKDGSNQEYLNNTITELRLNINTLRGYTEQDYGPLTMLKMDTQVVLPSAPIKPKTKLILAVCVLGGGFLGVLVVLILFAMDKRRALGG